MTVKTIEECGYIYEDAKALMDEREKDYEGSWREEGLDSAIDALHKKGNQLKVMFRNGRFFDNHKRSREDLLDDINYAVFAIRHLDIMNGVKKGEPDAART